MYTVAYTPCTLLPITCAQVMDRDRQTDRQADRQAGRQAGRQRNRQLGRQADRQAGRQRNRQTERQTGRQAGRQAGKQAGRHTGRDADRQAGRQADLVEVLRREGQVEHGWRDVHTVGSHGCLPAPSDVAKVIVGTVVVVKERNWRSKE